MVAVLALTSALLSIGVAFGAPTARSGVTTLTAAQIAAIRPFTALAAVSYCNPSTTINWSCGTNCNRVPGFVPYASGGDGGSTPFWYVGYDPNTKSVIVGHQGTDSSKILSLLNDAEFFLKKPDSGLFPGISSAVEGHSGFLDTHARSAATVFAAVNKALVAEGATTVTTVGHSLGGALASIEAVSLRQRLGSNIAIRSYTYGKPRVGNGDWANWVDAHIPGFTHVNHRKDEVPILPGRFLGYAHPNGEKHIYNSETNWVACSGHDNTDGQCTTGQVGNILEGSAGDHAGPYDGIQMGC